MSIDKIETDADLVREALRGLKSETESLKHRARCRPADFDVGRFWRKPAGRITAGEAGGAGDL